MTIAVVTKFISQSLCYFKLGERTSLSTITFSHTVTTPSGQNQSPRTHSSKLQDKLQGFLGYGSGLLPLWTPSRTVMLGVVSSFHLVDLDVPLEVVRPTESLVANFALILPLTRVHYHVTFLRNGVLIYFYSQHFHVIRQYFSG
jgi:hypothetical protein